MLNIFEVVERQSIPCLYSKVGRAIASLLMFVIGRFLPKTGIKLQQFKAKTFTARLHLSHNPKDTIISTYLLCFRHTGILI